MAKIKISQLTAKGANVASTDLLPIAEEAGGGLYVTKKITAGPLSVIGSGTASQYVRGDGTLATLPSSGSGGSSVFYYLNGSIAASVATYNQMDFNAVIGPGTNFPLVGNGLIAQFLTDAGNPNRLLIPSGAWNFEMFFSMSSVGGTQKFYVELLKYDGSTFTSIASSSTNPEAITGGTTTDLYITSLAVPSTVLLATDRLAVRVYIVDNSGARTATLHTEDNNLCQIITTFAGGVSSLNGLTANTQNFAVGTTGTDFNISSVTDIHTFNLPTASATNRGALSTTDWTIFNDKAPKEVTTVTYTAGLTTLQLSDNYKLLKINSAVANDLRIPTFVSVAFPLGTQIIVMQYGTGQTTIVTSGGVTLISSGGKTKIAAQYGMATLIKIDTNEWILAGDITI